MQWKDLMKQWVWARPWCWVEPCRRNWRNNAEWVRCEPSKFPSPPLPLCIPPCSEACTHGLSLGMRKVVILVSSSNKLLSRKEIWCLKWDLNVTCIFKYILLSCFYCTQLERAEVTLLSLPRPPGGHECHRCVHSLHISWAQPLFPSSTPAYLRKHPSVLGNLREESQI